MKVRFGAFSKKRDVQNHQCLRTFAQHRANATPFNSRRLHHFNFHVYSHLRGCKHFQLWRSDDFQIPAPSSSEISLRSWFFWADTGEDAEDPVGQLFAAPDGEPEHEAAVPAS
jgi:hypothetical protein